MADIFSLVSFPCEMRTMVIAQIDIPRQYVFLPGADKAVISTVADVVLSQFVIVSKDIAIRLTQRRSYQKRASRPCKWRFFQALFLFLVRGCLLRSLSFVVGCPLVF